MGFDGARHYFRNPSATAVTAARRALFVMPGASPLDTNGAPPAEVAALWESLAEPVSGRDLETRLSAAPPHLRQVLDLLLAGAFVVCGSPEEFATWDARAAERRDRPCPHLVLGVTGAVHAAFMPQMLRQLLATTAARVDVVLTESARQFVQPRALEAMGASVWCDPFESRDGAEVPHMHLAALAHLVLVMPATADAIFRLAHGAASDLVSLVVCATSAPVVVVPSMHPAMWRHAAVRRNVDTLRADGVYVIEPGAGFSVADNEPRQLGGAGLGAGAVNLAGVLDAIMALST